MRLRVNQALKGLEPRVPRRVYEPRLLRCRPSGAACAPRLPAVPPTPASCRAACTARAHGGAGPASAAIASTTSATPSNHAPFRVRILTSTLLHALSLYGKSASIIPLCQRAPHCPRQPRPERLSSSTASCSAPGAAARLRDRCGRARAAPVIGKGAAGAVPHFALQMHDASQLAAYRPRSAETEDFSSPFLARVLSLSRPGRSPVAFGLPGTIFRGRNAGLLQHFVSPAHCRQCSTLPRLGMVESDRVLETTIHRQLPALDPETTASRLPRAGGAPDTTLRDQRLALHPRLGRRMGKRGIGCVGTRAHGPGNNLFFMTGSRGTRSISPPTSSDPQSAARTGPRRTLNLWALRGCVLDSASASIIFFFCVQLAAESCIAELRSGDSATPAPGNGPTLFPLRRSRRSRDTSPQRGQREKGCL